MAVSFGMEMLKAVFSSAQTPKTKTSMIVPQPKQGTAQQGGVAAMPTVREERERKRLQSCIVDKELAGESMEAKLAHHSSAACE
eukprot:1071769-Pelagomonas_calceolata.AAC.2